MKFEIVGAIEQIETIASGRGVRIRTAPEGPRSRALAQRKGVATVRFPNGSLRRVSYIGTHGVGRRDFKVKTYLDEPMKCFTKQFALCLDNEGNEASLIIGKVYQIVPDPCAAKDALVRVIDENGDDYLFARSRRASADGRSRRDRV